MSDSVVCILTKSSQRVMLREKQTLRDGAIPVHFSFCSLFGQHQ